MHLISLTVLHLDNFLVMQYLIHAREYISTFVGGNNIKIGNYKPATQPKGQTVTAEPCSSLSDSFCLTEADNRFFLKVLDSRWDFNNQLTLCLLKSKWGSGQK